jgi:hypothetical protein
LCLPAVAGDQAVASVGAGDCCHAPGGIVVAGVVADGSRAYEGGGGEDGEGAGEFHFGGMGCGCR